jgi:hypothetical protein
MLKALLPLRHELTRCACRCHILRLTANLLDRRAKFTPEVKVSSTSTLVIDGAGIKFESLTLDGSFAYACLL